MPQQKIQEIVAKYGAEIYTNPKQFIAIISDYFPNDNFGALLKKVIEEGSKDIYKLRGLSGNELNINYTKTLDIISNKTFIAKDVILPALDLLCIGLEIDITAITKPAPPAPVVTPVAQPKQAPKATPVIPYANPIVTPAPKATPVKNNYDDYDFDEMLDTINDAIVDTIADTIEDVIDDFGDFGDFFTGLGNIFK